MGEVLRTENLSKRYGRHTALDGCSMTVKEGDIYGFVGNNGAGKTTLMKLVMGLTKASGGDFCLFGIPSSGICEKTRKRVSAIIESPAFYPHMTGLENLKLHMLALGRKVPDSRVRQILGTVGLALDSPKKVRGYSMGMKQRLGIARVLLSEADLAILDEPTNGLDPAGILDLRELILALNRERGTTFIISSHHVLELDSLVSRIGIIAGGRMVEERGYASLKSELAESGQDTERYFIDRARTGVF